MIVHCRVVDRDRQRQGLGREPPDRGEQTVRADDTIMLRGDQADARIDQGLLGVEHVERGALAGLRLIAQLKPEPGTPGTWRSIFYSAQLSNSPGIC